MTKSELVKQIGVILADSGADRETQIAALKICLLSLELERVSPSVEEWHRGRKPLLKPKEKKG